ncbi:TetR/AcrR family transcriptional regulator [Sphingomonas sp.]|uniref:TetR/AcrR family transcriptional regulator n=1 Tax=Sphingomonas sp. TaxID=28214 RepID=UPI001B27B8E8|nr:TetR/AcrR family transcriptional regulator [Sphingomonas sp.]MBO9711394.1 TetR family transcriptional regulator [Sphingomonas sp.]
MRNRKFLLADPAKPEAPDNPSTRERTVDALIALIAAGEQLNHDRVAERAGLSRRTVYRYFPDQSSLRAAAWERLGPPGGMPSTLHDFVGLMPERFGKFESNAEAMTVTMASPEGRAMRNVMTTKRVETFRALFAEQTAHLAEPARTEAIAALQYMGCGYAWLEMRDQWELGPEGAAAACSWAIETLLAELARGGGPGKGPSAA